jgi:alkanesulfonate monooxygenase SsuD/methylene tetrahydromethanopterin reductase-like flavin-dependent oxidoreductase (luciferase family)
MTVPDLARRHPDGCRVDLLLDPFGARWDDLRAAARTAEEAGFDGLWTWDHLAGSVHGADGVLESWTVLSALAATVPRVMLGPMVLNVANRRPGVLATAAATLQQVSGGRLLLGLGAGGGVNLPYPAEQHALGAEVPPDPVRRAQLSEAVAVVRHLWAGSPVELEGDHYALRPAARGFLRPEPYPPPVVIGGFGPRMAELAGRVGDGINLPAGLARTSDLVDVARRAHAAGGGDPDRFLVTVSAPFAEAWVRPERRAELAREGVDRVVLLVHPPFAPGRIEALAPMLGR